MGVSKMDNKEYQRRVLGDGTKIDLMASEVEASGDSVLIKLEKEPYELAFDRLLNKIKSMDTELDDGEDKPGYYPCYLQIADGDIFELDGMVHLTIIDMHVLKDILKYAEPTFYYIDDGKLGDVITVDMLVKTIKLGHRKTIHDII